MGYMRHNAIVITSFDKDLIEEVWETAFEIFKNISGIIPSEINGYYTLVIPPDGSKEGWASSDLGNVKRVNFINYLTQKRYDDGSSPLDWVEVQYGDDAGVTKIINYSDMDISS